MHRMYEIGPHTVLIILLLPFSAKQYQLLQMTTTPLFYEGMHACILVSNKSKKKMRSV